MAHLVLRLLITQTLGWDDAEQTLWAQELSWTYGVYQPPLYTWLVHGVSRLTGPGVLATALVRYGVLFAMYVGLLLAACVAFERRRDVVLAVAGYPLIYLFAFYAHHDLTHTSLMAAGIAVTLFALFAARRTGAWWAYALLGLALGCGMLSKYTFGLFALSLLAAAWLTPDFRRVVLNRRAWLVPIIALAICAPYYTHAALAGRSAGAVAGVLVGADDATAPSDRAMAIPRAAVAAVEFTLPFSVIAALVFPALWRSGRIGEGQGEVRRLLGLQMIIGTCLMALAALALGAAEVKGRWMLPALMALPLFLFSSPAAAAIGRRRARAYLYIVLAVSALAAAARIGVDHFEPRVERGCRRTLPVHGLRRPVTEMGFGAGEIVAESNHLGGNLAMLLPRARVHSACPGKGPVTVPEPGARVLYVWRGGPEPVPEETGEHARALGLVLSADREATRTLAIPFRTYPRRRAPFTLRVAEPAEPQAGGRPGAAE